MRTFDFTPLEYIVKSKAGFNLQQLRKKNLFRTFPLPAREKALFSPKCQQLIGQLYGNRSGGKQGEEKRKKKIALEDSFELFFFSARRVMEPSPVEKKRRRRKRYLTH